jgi:hypothetical protein
MAVKRIAPTANVGCLEVMSPLRGRTMPVLVSPTKMREETSSSRAGRMTDGLAILAAIRRASSRVNSRASAPWPDVHRARHMTARI